MSRFSIYTAVLAFWTLAAGAPGEGAAQTAQDSTRGRSGSVSVRAPIKRIPVTPEHLRSAFRDSAARSILAGARVARLQQDSALSSYDARGYQRISAGLGFSATGRDRLAYRREGATRIRWQRGVGAHVEVEGARAVAPIVGHPDAQKEVNDEARGNIASGDIQLPYFPGSETLWIGSDLARVNADERFLVHPLAGGSEAYYRYATGDSVQYLLPGGSEIRLVEMLITPRAPEWNLVVGSFWFDQSNFRLVRAVYRLAVPLDIWELGDDDNDVPILARSLITPIRGTVSAITVEYGLYQERFWLPRLQTAEGQAQVSFIRVPFELQQKYEYLSVNGDLGLPAIAATPEMARQDTLILIDSLKALGDSASLDRARAIEQALSAEPRDRRAELNARVAAGDSSALAELRRLRPPPRREVCDTAAAQTRLSRMANRTVMVLTTVPCNDSLLVNSPHLPPSIFTPNDELYTDSDRDKLLRLLDMNMQSDWALQRPVVRYGFGDGLLRYNRIEGLAPAVGVAQQTGNGFSIDALARYGTADHEFNGELSVSRTDGRRSWRVAGFKRLVASNPWGNPLSFGSSFQALVFGRDEGFYYRAAGAELAIAAEGNPRFEWKLFGERHRRARVEAEFSVADALGDKQFPGNIEAQAGDLFGISARLNHSLGVNPSGFRLLSDVRAEHGLGDFGFARGMFDVTLSRGLTYNSSAALTLSAGSSVGELPVQRQFVLGGTQSIRGQPSGSAFGDAFWMARGELGTGAVGAKPVVFVDVGWAGSRADWARQSRALTGAGVGVSFLDGLIRIDLAKGLYPERGVRFYSYFEARF